MAHTYHGSGTGMLPGRAMALLLGLSLGCSEPAAPPAAPPSPSSAPAPHGAPESTNPWLAAFRERAQRTPDDGALLFNLAVLCDQSGASAEALTLLRKLDALGWDFPLRDALFPSLASTPEYRALAAAIAAREPHAEGSRVAFTLPERDLIPEGITHDPATGAFFLGSLAKRKIVRIAPGGSAADFVPTGRDQLGEVVGIHVDAGRRLLWAVSNPLPRKGGQGLAALFAFDLATGELKHRLPPPDDGVTDRLLNDMTVGPDGEVFVTDSNSGAVYTSSPKTDTTLRPLLPPGSLSGPNGLVYFPEGGVLLVAYDVGIVAVNPRTGAFHDVSHAPAQAIGSIDGLALSGRTLWGVQNGLGAPRIVRMEIDASGPAVTSLRVLEARSPALEIPTTGVLASDGFYFIANSQLAALGHDGRVRDPERLHDVVVRALPLAPESTTPTRTP